MKEKRIPELDGIRGVAILLVIIWHYFNNQVVKEHTSLIDFGTMLTSNLWSGVDLFFILSGFLIGGILLKAKESANYFRTFYLRRLFRIFPVYYLLLILYLLFILAIPNLNEIIPTLFNNYIPAYSYFFLFQNYMMIIKQTFGATWLAVTWSLAVEEQFYLLLPLLIFFLNRKALGILALVLIVAAAFFRFYSSDWYYYHFAFQCRMDTLFTGVLMAMLFENQTFVDYLKSKKKIVYTMFLLSFSWFLYLSISKGSNFYFLTYSGIIVVYALLIMIGLLYKESIVARILRNSFLRKIGVVSYGIYLFHLIVIYFIYWVLEKWGVDVYNNFYIVITGVGAFLITYGISIVSYRFFESRLINYSHRYKY